MKAAPPLCCSPLDLFFDRGADAEGNVSMSRHFEDDGRVRRRNHRRHRRRISHRLPFDPHPDPEVESHDSDLGRLEDIDESLLSPEERSYRRARKTAEKKIDFYREAAKLGIAVFFLAIFIWPVACIVMFFGGIKLGRRYYRLMIEPGIRRRLIQEEVGERVQQGAYRERQALEGEHARSLERLSASIAHEIRNPITAAKSLVQQMEEDPTGEQNVEYARVALSELKRVESSISHLLRFAREEDLRTQPLAMADVLESAVETFRDRSARGGIEIRRRFDCEGSLEGDPEKLRRVFINLLGNAIDALEQAEIAEPLLEVSLGENLAGSEVWVRIRDNGPGIDGDLGDRIFDPFVTAKSGGTGLGLSITKKLVEAHGGTIEVESQPGEGTEFVVTLPKPTLSRGASS